MATIRSQVTGAFDLIEKQQPDAIQVGHIRAVIISFGGGPSDTVDSAKTFEDTSARMVVLEINDRRIDGTNIMAGDFQVIVEPVGVEIKLEDKIICDRGTLTIAKLGLVASGGETALNDLVCRG
jgi:hypothetical protein